MMKDALADLVAEVRHHLYLPDPAPLYAVLAAVAANRLTGDPVWLLLVGPPSCGKTEMLNLLDELPDVWRLDMVTEAGLLTEGRDGQLGGILGDIARRGGRGLLVVKDLSTVLSESPQRRAGLFAAFRRLYDGEWERDLGTGGGTRLRFEGKVGLLGAVTDAIDRLAVEIGDLGPRMLMFRMPDVDAETLMRAAGRNVGRQPEMRATLAGACARFFEQLGPLGNLDDLVDVTGDDGGKLVALARLAAWARSPVIRDPWGQREIDAVPRAEAGARLYAALVQLAGGAIAVGLDDVGLDGLITKVALDAIPAPRRAILDHLGSHPGLTPTTPTLADAIHLSTGATGRHAEDLTALGLLERSAGTGGSGEHYWGLAAETRRLLRTAGLIDAAPLRLVGDDEVGPA